MRKVAASLVSLLLLAAFGFADSVSMKLDSAGNSIANGVYVGPYQISVNNGFNKLLWCDDYEGRISVNQTWNASVTRLSSGYLSDTQWRDEQKYRQAGGCATNL